MWPTDTLRLPSLAGQYVGSIGLAVQPEARGKAAKRPAAPDAVFGYPATWPAGPWVVPLFWLAVALVAWLLQLCG
jgi:hypothetical protein